ncbi:MAG: succinate dehydrogenase [Rhodospirillales bacterium]|nr:succinate dehydrogenase [Rhodospirillales bacterium]MDH3917077.1 succinate dehydrogenase [Rhodospirillales bacterium]MDH3968266.1 succinate dehydrogenase [Rhodospirillales bacterium]
MTAWLSLLQRFSALILAPLVLVHLGLMVYAIGDGLTAAEILERTRGSILWGAFYGLFVIAAAVHGPIGLRTVLAEMTPWHGKSLDLAMLAFGLALLGLGARALLAVVLPGAAP